jgi:hypothetical protein
LTVRNSALSGLRNGSLSSQGGAGVEQGIPQRLKPLEGCGVERPKAEALGYLEATAPDPGLWPKSQGRVGVLELRRAPLLAAACWFALGVVMAREWRSAGVLLEALVLLVGLVVVGLRRELRVVVVPVAAVWVVVGVVECSGAAGASFAAGFDGVCGRVESAGSGAGGKGAGFAGERGSGSGVHALGE